MAGIESQDCICRLSSDLIFRDHTGHPMPNVVLEAELSRETRELKNAFLGYLREIANRVRSQHDRNTIKTFLIGSTTNVKLKRELSREHTTPFDWFRVFTKMENAARWWHWTEIGNLKSKLFPPTDVHLDLELEHFKEPKVMVQGLQHAVKHYFNGQRCVRASSGMDDSLERVIIIDSEWDTELNNGDLQELYSLLGELWRMNNNVKGITIRFCCVTTAVNSRLICRDLSLTWKSNAEFPLSEECSQHHDHQKTVISPQLSKLCQDAEHIFTVNTCNTHFSVGGHVMSTSLTDQSPVVKLF